MVDNDPNRVLYGQQRLDSTDLKEVEVKVWTSGDNGVAIDIAAYDRNLRIRTIAIRLDADEASRLASAILNKQDLLNHWGDTSTESRPLTLTVHAGCCLSRTAGGIAVCGPNFSLGVWQGLGGRAGCRVAQAQGGFPQVAGTGRAGQPGSGRAWMRCQAWMTLERRVVAEHRSSARPRWCGDCGIRGG